MNNPHEGGGFQPELSLEMISGEKQARLRELFSRLDKLESQDQVIEKRVHEAQVATGQPESETKFPDYLSPELNQKYLKNDGELDDVREELRSMVEEIYPNTKEYDDGMATEFGQAEINVQKIRNLLEV